MAEVNSVFFTIEGDRLKLLSKVILGLALFSSIFEPDVSGAIAVVGLLAVVLGNLELLFTFILLCPMSILFDILRLVAWKSKWYVIVIDVVEMLMKAVALWFAWSLWSNRNTGNYQPYTSTDGAPQGTAKVSSDPFSHYQQPPNNNNDAGNTTSDV